ncbi:hypothetical protein ACIRL2_39360 [Embleya sp. NPDC127516]|uniref:hypothetical protein n=1 Tax=Embleya sp. NPDC127516 TaxID=3363990 RepID=UPI00381A8306
MEGPDKFVRNAIAARPDIPPGLRERIVATPQTDNPVAEWVLAYRRDSNVGGTPPPVPPILTREQAEALLARTDL